ncbi:MAG: enoyl-CoA hydratase-related protein [Alphaproteobacteria bacterium]|nr:enoyl-CoA hydratase-related protein [Alphaproteobacteria bacterium]
MSDNNKDIILLDIKDGVATLTLNRPEVHNAFNEDMIARLSETFDDIASRSDIIALVLKGAGKSFSAGADLNWMKKSVSFTAQQNKEDALALASMLNKFNHLPQLTIACVHGAAMGGGMGLVSCCDIVIADESAKFALSEVKLGLIPATIAPYVISAIGQRQARRYMQTGERFGAQKAVHIGLVHEHVENAEEMDHQLGDILDCLRGNGPQAMREAKKLCFDISGKSVDKSLMEDTATRIADIRVSDEAQERLANFLEKK